MIFVGGRLRSEEVHVGWDEIERIFNVIATFAVAVAAISAVVQLQQIRRDRRRERELETKGVAVTWRSLETPTGVERGPTVWKLELSVSNPGRFPITGIRARVQLASPVMRIHFDGSRDEPVEQLELAHAVLIGGDIRRWERTVQVPAGIRPLDGCSATVEFREPDGTSHTNEW
ncbi:hypothetical protein Q6350_03635 [Isoptericola sp. b515]|uniref:hypothetical protein n=1 Tax=Isoptericola sp. b515 TaxID=3064652 RepID=UPI002713057B|nr:hypothetical protein [Isoptericola sp. b515]MDO8147515.1 hypothetical protein [Isoptericola sp. b515]